MTNYNHVTAKVVADTRACEPGARLITLELMYPRFIHSEVMTHRSIAKNAASSRAIPTSKLLDMVKSQPVMPLRFGQNQSGMQDTGSAVAYTAAAQEVWLMAARAATTEAERLHNLGVHKQVVNRLLEPFLPIKVVATGNYGIHGYGWNQFIDLRASVAAQPEIAALGTAVREAIEASAPTDSPLHTPYVAEGELNDLPEGSRLLVSAARCARVSYYDMPLKSADDELELARKLASQQHLSPFDHPAFAILPEDYADLGTEDFTQLMKAFIAHSFDGSPLPSGFDLRHLRGWKPLRTFVENLHA